MLIGNTCRSPIAEAVFKNYVKKMELTDYWEVDSAALELYHIGESPNERAIDILAKNGIDDYDHVARFVSQIILIIIS